jgi:GMP synthase-like glutamine amidotransferase
MRIHYLQHVPFEDLAGLETWAQARRHTISATRLFQNEALPGVNEVDLLIILGGPMNIYEEDKYTWLTAEKKFIETAIREEKKVLGICLGSQLIAAVLGARIFQNPDKEIGWLPITLTEEAQSLALFSQMPRQFQVFHWHGDTFNLPHQAIHLARSEGCENQAFLYGSRVLALQFHLESNRQSIQRMVEHEIDDITEGRYVQTPEKILSEDKFFEESHTVLSVILDRLTGEST